MSKLTALNILKEKLGEDGVNALIEVIEEERERTRDHLFRLLEERFARRLAEEIGKLRSEMHDEIGMLRAEVHREIAKVWNEIGKLRAEMHDEIGKLKADMIKWMFVFWATQMLAIMGILFTLFRFMK